MSDTTQHRGKTHNPTVGIRMEPEVKARLHVIAEREKIPAGTLARKWVIERMEDIEAEFIRDEEPERLSSRRDHELARVSLQIIDDAEEAEEAALDRMQEDHERDMLGIIDA